MAKKTIEELARELAIKFPERVFELSPEEHQRQIEAQIEAQKAREIIDRAAAEERRPKIVVVAAPLPAPATPVKVKAARRKQRSRGGRSPRFTPDDIRKLHREERSYKKKHPGAFEYQVNEHLKNWAKDKDTLGKIVSLNTIRKARDTKN
jgi:hypothetical protein